MKAVIVAAGKGTRLFPLTLDMPKCLIPVNGVPIIDYQLAALKANNIENVVVVTGHLEHKIREYLEEKHGREFSFTFVSNSDYHTSQNAYSLFLAKEHLTEDFVIFNSDLIFPSNLLTILLEDAHPDGMIADDYTEVSSDMVKIQLEGSRIVHMSKQLEHGVASAEAVGPVKFSQQGGQAFFDFLEQSFAAEGIRNWLFYMLGDFGKTYPFHAIKNPQLDWVEVDTLADHSLAEEKSRSIHPLLFIE